MPPTERDAALIQATASVLAGLIVAHERGDVLAVADELGKLLTAVARYTRTRTERPSDEALRRAIGRL